MTWVMGIAGLLSGLALGAQPQAGGPDSAPTRWALNPYVGIARGSLVGTRLGVTPDRNHVLAGVRIAADLVTRPHWSVSYAPEVGLLVISNNREYEISWEENFEFVGTGPIYGFATSPIGLEGKLRVATNWRMYGAGAFGFVWFNRPLPTAYGREFNYTFEFGGGALWQFRRGQSLRMGCKFHHLSNNYTALDNSGIDGAVFLVGFDYVLGRR